MPDPDTKSDDLKESQKSDNPDDNKDSKAEAHWQKIAEQRRLEIETLKAEHDTIKQQNNSSEIDQLRKQLNELANERTLAHLENEYPDIEPTLLLNKPADEIKTIVEKQRDRTKKHFANSIEINPPKYSENEIAKQIDNIKKSTKTPIEKAQQIMKLKRLAQEG